MFCFHSLQLWESMAHEQLMCIARIDASDEWLNGIGHNLSPKMTGEKCCHRFIIVAMACIF